MNYEIVEALSNIVRNKNIENEFVLDTVKEALVQAAQKKLGSEAIIELNICKETGTIEMYHVRKVVEEVENPVREISLEKASEIQFDIELGEDLYEEIKVSKFGRGAIKAAKQIIVQRLKEAERAQIFEEYSGRIGEMVTGTIQQIERNPGGGRNVMVSLGKTEALLPASQTLKRERFYQGEPIKAVILEVRQDTKGPQIILTRSHPEMLKKMFASEVHEIEEGIVEIKAVAREAGERSKVAVYSHYDSVDAVGACVGIKGSRVQNIVQEFNGERIDVVPWSSEPKLFVSKALSPAKVSEVIKNSDDDRTVTVVVKDDQYSLAIGKSGQNARLAAKLTGYRIDIIPESKFIEAEEKRRSKEIDIMDIPGVTDRIKSKLMSAGYEIVQDLIDVDESELMEIPGIGRKTAENILNIADVILEELDKQIGEDSEESGNDEKEVQEGLGPEDGEEAENSVAVNNDDGDTTE